jgi:membrane-associated phospholipid phosphatase
VVLATTLTQAAAAQEAAPRPAFSSGQAVSFSGAAALFATALILDWTEGPPPCAPCNPQDVPGFDRWAIRPVQAGFARVSDVLLLGIAGGSLWDLGRGPNGGRRVTAALESAGWAFAITQLSKSLIGRQRPVMYTVDAGDAADQVKNQRSMPSGHTSMAFALATSYVLNSPEREPLPKIVALAAAVGVAAARVAAAKHFPSDVVVGAAVGVASAFVIHEIRF